MYMHINFNYYFRKSINSSNISIVNIKIESKAKL
uniref:Uncharacterized protein n=1 Tax=Lepeophtheirus salmonis TaxID=72036 RepID=A0A0K2VGP7_LEPSM